MRKLVAGTAPMGAAVPLAHRDDVDGLRAVAVLAILAFHLDLAGFSGGFVGVDVFFVISGYVILRSILPDLEGGRFSLGDFLVRRMRRILPALLVVLAATLAVGFAILSPRELVELAGSALSTVVFGANFYFHRLTNYFASAAHARPLLHMWSLGIEEQFYILVPLTITWLMRSRGAGVGSILAVLAVASFAFSLFATPKQAFYLPMARFWEIALGGCVAVAERRWGVLRTGANMLAGAGLVAIAGSVHLLDSEGGGQRWVVVAVAGAAAVIAGDARQRGPVNALLAWRPLVAIGRISFSVYLVHWPLIVFWRLYTLRPLLPHEQVAIAVATVALAALLYAVVEKPMRAGSRRIGNRPALAGIGAATVAVAVTAVVALIDSGASWRLRGPAREAFVVLRKAVADRPSCARDTRWREVRVCRWNPQAGTDVVIFGDSQADALWAELAEALGGAKGGVAVIKRGCPPIDGVEVAESSYGMGCGSFAKVALEIIERERPRLVVVAAAWSAAAPVLDASSPSGPTRRSRLVDLEGKRARIELADALMRTVARVRTLGARVVVVGPAPGISYDVPTALVRTLQGIGQLPPTRRSDFDLHHREVMAALAEVGAIDGVAVVYPHTVLCDEAACAVADGLRALYADSSHPSPFGAARVSALVAQALERRGWMLANVALPSLVTRGE